MILAELTKTQRALIMEMATKRMDEMRDADPNAWLSYEYAQLENLAYQLFVECAE